MKIAGLDLSISSSGVVVETLDDNFEIQSVQHYGFTNKKKLTMENIEYYSNKDFLNDYQKYQWMADKIFEWCKDCDYVAVENYAFGKTGATGMIFSLAEFEGNIKLGLFNRGKKLRFYAVNQIKKFFTEYGLSDKIGMKDAFEKKDGVKPDLSLLPEVDNGHGVSPTSDIIDAFAICEYLRKELRLRNGIELLHEQTKTIIECFNAVTKEHPMGLLAAPFIEKEV